MIYRPSRRDLVKTAVSLTAAGAVDARTVFAHDKVPASIDRATVSRIDSMLHAATRAGEVPGIVALAATDDGTIYEGSFGRRRLQDGPAMTRDTVFRVASMVKLMTSVAALQLVEQSRLSLDAPVPEIDPAVGSPMVLEGFDAK